MNVGNKKKIQMNEFMIRERAYKIAQMSDFRKPACECWLEAERYCKDKMNADLIEYFQKENERLVAQSKTLSSSNDVLRHRLLNQTIEISNLKETVIEERARTARAELALIDVRKDCDNALGQLHEARAQLAAIAIRDEKNARERSSAEAETKRRTKKDIVARLEKIRLVLEKPPKSAENCIVDEIPPKLIENRNENNDNDDNENEKRHGDEPEKSNANQGNEKNNVTDYVDDSDRKETEITCDLIGCLSGDDDEGIITTVSIEFANCCAICTNRFDETEVVRFRDFNRVCVGGNHDLALPALPKNHTFSDSEIKQYHAAQLMRTACISGAAQSCLRVCTKCFERTILQHIEKSSVFELQDDDRAQIRLHCPFCTIARERLQKRRDAALERMRKKQNNASEVILSDNLFEENATEKTEETTVETEYKSSGSGIVSTAVLDAKEFDPFDPIVSIGTTFFRLEHSGRVTTQSVAPARYQPSGLPLSRAREPPALSLRFASQPSGRYNFRDFDYYNENLGGTLNFSRVTETVQEETRFLDTDQLLRVLSPSAAEIVRKTLDYQFLSRIAPHVKCPVDRCFYLEPVNRSAAASLRSDARRTPEQRLFPFSIAFTDASPLYSASSSSSATSASSSASASFPYDTINCPEHGKHCLHCWKSILDHEKHVCAGLPDSLQDCDDAEELRRCPQCCALIVRDGGCDHMRCSSCNFAFDWKASKAMFSEKKQFAEDKEHAEEVD